MKILTLIALCFYTCIGYSQYSDYVFNFGAGKIALWNDPLNWEGGVVPPSEVGKITIAPPDDSPGWECRLDVDGISCYDTLRIKSNATFTILNEVTLRSYKNITVENSAALDVSGYCNVFCNYPGTDVITSYGTVTVYGAIQNDPESLCLGFGFYNFRNYGPLYVYGQVNLALGVINCSDLLYVSGSILSSYRGSLVTTGPSVNKGTLSGNLSVSVHDLENNGQINLTGNDFFQAGLIINGSLVNYRNIYVEKWMSLSGTLVNKGEITTGNVCQVLFDSVDIINDSIFSMNEETTLALPNNQSSLVNNGSFSFLPYNDPGFVTNMNLINHGTISVNGWDMSKGSAINYQTMNISANTGSSYIRVPVINLGTINTYGPIVIGDAFINKGQLNTQ